jgi:hypothetical protein
MVLALLVSGDGSRRGSTSARPSMTTPTLMLTLAMACLALQGCILFTQSVNEAPDITINAPNGSVNRGEPIPITANVSDPDGDVPRVEWWTTKDGCPTNPDARQRPASTVLSQPGMAMFTFTPSPGDPETMCVWALATDSQGATALDTQEVSSQNRPPVAAIQVLAPTTQTGSGRYQLYSYFRLSGLGSSDPDGDDRVDPQWTLTVPQGAVPTPRLVPCPGAMPSPWVQCLDVGASKGVYRVELTVGDGLTRSTPSTLTLDVDDDHPACVKTAEPPTATSPLVLDPTGAKTFSIKEILDDGSPLPTPADGAHAAPSFAWKVRRNAGAWQAIVGYEGIAALTLPAGTYATGDKVDVSVTISDGVAMHVQPACDARCPAGCPQSAQWTVEYR